MQNQVSRGVLRYQQDRVRQQNLKMEKLQGSSYRTLHSRHKTFERNLLSLIPTDEECKIAEPRTSEQIKSDIVSSLL